MRLGWKEYADYPYRLHATHFKRLQRLGRGGGGGVGLQFMAAFILKQPLQDEVECLMA